ncbi:DNA internalization-related competence protein ComEC/Rec2 [Alteromonas sp. H39]|uniref:DNA internalization-related competence protein ComEC/Rec2 n=1 Tax=Alteromonas sp. H39 TaxID=3389876 RepID=UPI0039E0ED56
MLLAFQSLYRLRYPFLPRIRRKSSYSGVLTGTGKVIQGVSIGILWMASVGHWYVVWQLPVNNIHQDVTVKGDIVEVDCDSDKQQLTISVDSVDNEAYFISRRIRVYEYEPNTCRTAGQGVSFTARLKPAAGLANPGGFDYQRLLVSKNIVATGYVRAWHYWHQPSASVRQQIKRFIILHAGSDPKWLLALLLGDRSGLSTKDWDILQKTGTAHLFSVSGMHVGIIATALVLLAKIGVVVWSRWSGSLSPFRNVRRPIAVMVCLAAAGYVSLTGAALPAVRAWVLLAICFTLTTSAASWSARHIALVMTTVCFILFPLQVLSAGFVLSLAAVYSIWFLLWRYRLAAVSWWQAGIIMQVGLSLLLIPITVSWFSLISLLSLPVNLVLIPLITLSLPWLLLSLGAAMLLPACASDVISYSVALLNAVAVVLEHVAAQPGGVLQRDLPPGPLLMLMIAMLLLVMPAVPYRKRCVMLCLLPVLMVWVPHRSDRWFLHVFDVGQGTALAVTRGDRAILIDTGPAFNENAFAMENAVLPALTRLNIRHVDGVIVSHSDNDHAGGVNVLRRHALTHQHTFWHTPVSGCQQGTQFQWQSLTFYYHWPMPGNQTNDNASSCVVTVKDGDHSVLLPGDIERTTEYRLLAQQEIHATTLLIAPHHGSQTSSTKAWVKATQPDTVIFTTGYLNRWQFPSDVVKARYQETGARQVNTATSGYIRVAFTSGTPPLIQRYRQDLAPAWYHEAILSPKGDHSN